MFRVESHFELHSRDAVIVGEIGSSGIEVRSAVTDGQCRVASIEIIDDRVQHVAKSGLLLAREHSLEDVVLAFPIGSKIGAPARPNGSW